MKFYAIKQNHLYLSAYRKGGHKSSKTMTVYVLRDRRAAILKKENPLKQTINRIGISASKKIGGAVQRNRAKRVVREAYRQIDREIGVRRGYLIVIVPRAECTVCKTGDAVRDMTHCLSALGMLEEKAEEKSAGGGDAVDPDTVS